MDAYWNIFQRTVEPGARFPALLKIDVDNGDCEYLAEFLHASYVHRDVNIGACLDQLPQAVEVALLRGHDRGRDAVLGKSKRQRRRVAGQQASGAARIGLGEISEIERGASCSNDGGESDGRGSCVRTRGRGAACARVCVGRGRAGALA